MKTEKQYADELIEQHYSSNQPYTFELKVAIKNAINDVTNTIKALDNISSFKTTDIQDAITYYQTVLQILKERR